MDRSSGMELSPSLRMNGGTGLKPTPTQRRDYLISPDWKSIASQKLSANSTYFLPVSIEEAQPGSVQPFDQKSVNNIGRLRSDFMASESRKLYRSRTNRMVLGVCAGLADFFGIDPTIVRLIFAVGTLFGFGSFIFIYIVMFLVIPEEPIAPA